MRASTIGLLSLSLTACGARTELIVEDPPTPATDANIDSVAIDTSPLDTFAPGPDTTADTPPVLDVAEDDGPIVLPGTAAKEIASASSTTCIVTVAGQLRCFGTNESGQVGDGTTSARRAPTPPVLDGVARVSASDQTVCARMIDGTVRCWGVIRNGQAGGSLPAAENATTPRVVPGVTDVVDVAVAFEVCAVTKDGAVLCWGGCPEGVEGPCTSVPRAIGGLGRVVQIGNAPRTKCVLRAAGDVWCWGSNANGALGDGTTKDREVPAPVPGLSDVESIAVGGSIFGGLPFSTSGTSVCALKNDGTVWCWGMRLKDGAPRPVNRPERVLGLSARPVRIATYGPLSCALGDDKRVECWGFSTRGGFGIPGGVPWESARVVSVPPSVAIAVGADRACAVGVDGRPRCWGAPLVGDGTTLERHGPTLVTW